MMALATTTLTSKRKEGGRETKKRKMENRGSEGGIQEGAMRTGIIEEGSASQEGSPTQRAQTNAGEGEGEGMSELREGDLILSERKATL